MPSAAVKFSGSETPSVDELAGGTPAQTNVAVDAAGAIRMRPGVAELDTFPAAPASAGPVVQIGSWQGIVIYVTEDRQVWSFTPGLVTALSSGSPATKVDGGLRPVIASTRTRAIITGGGRPQKWEGAGLSARLGGSPPVSSHVATIAQRVVLSASDPSGIVYWSGIGDTGAETWLTGLNFREAETKQDRLVGLYENSNELVALGTETIQMLSPDPSETFTNARSIPVGWGSPHSYIQLDEMFMGLDARDRVVLSNGRSLETISSPAIGRQLEEAETSDAWGFRYKFENYDLGALVLPTDGRTFVYDAGGKSWTEWRGYDSATGGFGRFNITAAYYWPEQKTTLVGLSDGRLARLDPSATTDLGEPIVCQLTSTFEDHNSTRLKHCQHLRFKFHRGGDAIGGTNVMLYSYRDDLGPFCEPFRIPIGDPTDVSPVVVIDSPGMPYRVRQHRIVVDSTAFRFAGLTEEYALLSQ